MEKKSIYNIIIADDHEIVRNGVKFTTQTQKNLHIKDEAASFAELMELLLNQTYDLLILDLNLGDKNGIQSIREISNTFKDLPILILSMFPENPYALKSIEAGALGYINKKMLSGELLKGINCIIDGEVYIHEDYKETLPFGTNLNKTPRRSTELLSKREFEVYSFIALGISYKEIANKLNLSPKTISTYRTRIFEKLGLENINQLIHFSLQDSLGNTDG